ncbi:MAG: hypothetical protein M3R36_02840 [Bacteroidota bacterium]|nr:hypothetical protein [Bacteroidota bacterium]
MKIVSKLYDKRISAQNVLTEMSIKEYSEIAENTTKNNQYQRKRVKGSATVYFELFCTELVIKYNELNQ